MSAFKSDVPSTVKPASHDPATPKALVDFMLQGWKSTSGPAAAKIRHAGVFAERRKALSRVFPGETLVIPTGHEKVRSNDTYYRFRPSSDFYYLTGSTEPDCVLILVPINGGHEEVLFVEPNTRGDATFFTDRDKGELWAGPRLGVEKSRQRYAISECRSLRELNLFLGGIQGRVRVLRGFAPQIDAWFPVQEGDAELARVLSEMRLIKDSTEIAELAAAVRSTKRGFEDVILRLKSAKSEREIEVAFDSRARLEGNDVGYGTIAACGGHACVLHWRKNDGKIRRGDLFLLDAGVERETLYTADITRTLPVSGKFSKEQRVIYDLVYKAQRAAMAAVKPGNDFLDPNRAAMEVLAQGLFDLGILKESVDVAMREDQQLYRRYTLHNVSHMLGLDVHDCAQARQEEYRYGKLKPGMVLTIEPGLYFQPDDLTVPPKFRGIGIRIEDDVVVTPKGHRNLSVAIPAEASAVEAWMARVWKGALRRR